MNYCTSPAPIVVSDRGRILGAVENLHHPEEGKTAEVFACVRVCVSRAIVFPVVPSDRIFCLISFHSLVVLSCFGFFLLSGKHCFIAISFAPCPSCCVTGPCRCVR